MLTAKQDVLPFMHRVWFLSVVILLTSVTHASATPLNLGSISNEPADELRIFTPVVNYLAKQLAPQGITKGSVVIAASMKEMADKLKNGQVDLYMDSPMPSIAVNQLAGSKMALRRWKKGVAEYHSVIFVQKESGIQNLAQLAGKMIGFENAYSSSSYILPRIAMMQTGLNLVKLADFRGKVPEGKTGYIFNDDDENTLMRVLLGKTTAGAMAESQFQELGRDDIDKLHIIHETFKIPRHIVSLRGNFPVEQEKALLQAFQEMDKNVEGKAILKAFQKTTRFDAIPPETLTRLQQITPTVLELLEIKP